VLKLTYHTTVFGPIDLEYDRPVIRVGRSEDNDLVLRHPSVAPHHCVLVFQGEKVLCLPPSQAMGPQSDVQDLGAPELGPDDLMKIGELQFRLVHSPRTVAVPELHYQASDATSVEPGKEVGQRRYYCSRCRTFIREAEVKRFGLVGHAKHNLCPMCSRPVEAEREPQRPASGLIARLRQAVRKLLR
jgi:hypothetical protein